LLFASAAGGAELVSEPPGTVLTVGGATDDFPPPFPWDEPVELEEFDELDELFFELFGLAL